MFHGMGENRLTSEIVEETVVRTQHCEECGWYYHSVPERRGKNARNSTAWSVSGTTVRTQGLAPTHTILLEFLK